MRKRNRSLALAAPRGDPFQVAKRRRERRTRRDVRRDEIADGRALASVDASRGARDARQRRERERDATRIARRFRFFFNVGDVVDGRDARRDGRDYLLIARAPSAHTRRDRAVRAKRRDGTIVHAVFSFGVTFETFVFVLRAKETETRLAEQDASC